MSPAVFAMPPVLVGWAAVASVVYAKARFAALHRRTSPGQHAVTTLLYLAGLIWPWAVFFVLLWPDMCLGAMVAMPLEAASRARHYRNLMRLIWLGAGVSMLSLRLVQASSYC